MKVELVQSKPQSLTTELIALAISSKGSSLKNALSLMDAQNKGAGASELVRRMEFDGKDGQLLRIPVGKGKATLLYLLVGIGEQAWDTNLARIFAIQSVQAAGRSKNIALVLGTSDESIVRAAAQGAHAGSYRYLKYKSGDDAKPCSVQRALLVVDKKVSSAMRDAAKAGAAVAEAINFARDLVNGPPNDVTPLTMATAAQQQSRKRKLRCEIWNKRRIAQAKMDLFMAVNQGSAFEPRLIHVVYKPKKKARAKVSFVGKGLTFDSGGLCIKPADSMISMKCDMAGAAATLAIVFAAKDLGLNIEVHGIVGATENMTGSAAYRPGDVYKSYVGKTVEIINTDAEGRLVLADVLAYAAKDKPDYLIDHATLTGACMVALGPTTAGLFTEDDKLAKDYAKLAHAAGEEFWRLPLDKKLCKQLKSDIADLKHCGSRWGGAITAALFLKEFVGKTKWMHLDIAGPAFLEAASHHQPKGGTGFGVAAAIAFLESL